MSPGEIIAIGNIRVSLTLSETEIRTIILNIDNGRQYTGNYSRSRFPALDGLFSDWTQFYNYCKMAISTIAESADNPEVEALAKVSESSIHIYLDTPTEVHTFRLTLREIPLSDIGRIEYLIKYLKHTNQYTPEKSKALLDKLEKYRLQAILT
jgi:hypothetical protein